jgi:hypothetical protein
VDEPKPCEVLIDDVWCPGRLLQWWRREDGWHGLVEYIGPNEVKDFAWTPAERLRPLDQQGTLDERRS